LDSTRSLFAAHKLRCTHQRVALYETLRASCAHPTAEELHRLARPHAERLSLATVYNTLEVLCEAGLARKFPMGNGCCRYDADTSDHLHVRYRDTMELADVPADLGRRFLEGLPAGVLGEIERRLGVEIDGVHIQILARTKGHDGGKASRT
jgi:Fe2+ or Zn2+ uptake regulation protein